MTLKKFLKHLDTTTVEDIYISTKTTGFWKRYFIASNDIKDIKSIIPKDLLDSKIDKIALSRDNPECIKISLKPQE